VDLGQVAAVGLGEAELELGGDSQPQNAVAEKGEATVGVGPVFDPG
jgi:hypothetical protein